MPRCQHEDWPPWHTQSPCVERQQEVPGLEAGCRELLLGLGVLYTQDKKQSIDSMQSLSSYQWYFSENNGTPLQCSCLENPMDRGAWWAAVHGVVKSRTRLSDFPFTFHFHASEKEMATHFSILAWRIPGTEEPGALLSMVSHRVGHD